MQPEIPALTIADIIKTLVTRSGLPSENMVREAHAVVDTWYEASLPGTTNTPEPVATDE